jgi:two-component system alkaline phosphatase synthesis response regulator PhoP/two-component system response regulator VicR
MPRRVLVVDDEKPITRLLQVNLEQAGYEVAVAHDGRDALKKLDSFEPELLILDIAMPYADGFEILEILRSDPASKDLPVVFLTAKSQERDIFRGYQTGVDCYLTKPFEPSDVITVVNRIFQGLEDED